MSASVRRRFRPTHPLPERPPLGQRRAGTEGARRGRPRGEQPWAGVRGLPAVGGVSAVLVFAWGGAEATFHVLGVLVVFALPVASVIALWWEDWPGSELRPQWSGAVDTLVVAGGGVVLALVAQMALQHPDPVVLFLPEVPAGHVAAAPALVPLGVAVFTAFLQISLVTEGWPLRRLGRLAGGAAALAASWLLGLAAEQLLLRTGALPVEAFLGLLGWVSALQVLGWVVPPTSVLARVRSRPLRLVAGNLLTIGGGTGVCVLAYAVVSDQATVGPLAAGVVGAGLVVGMLFESWPVTELGAAVGGAIAVVITLALAALGVQLCSLLVPVLGLRGGEAAAWSTYALDGVAAAVILHVGIFRRWPVSAAR